MMVKPGGREGKRMRRGEWVALVIAFVALACVLVFVGVVPSVQDYQSRNRVYDDLHAASTQIMDANVNIINITTEDAVDESGDVTVANADEGVTVAAVVSYGWGASGAIIARDGDTYYALTAYHVVSETQNTVYRVMTPETLPSDGVLNSMGSAYYDTLPEARTVYAKEDSDLAIVKFQSDVELAVADVAAEDPQKGDRVMAIGNPVDGGRFVPSYGKVLSSQLEMTDYDDGQPDCAILRHSAYEAPGSSGSGVYDESMELVGINVGGATDGFGRFRYGMMVPASQLRECIAGWEEQEGR